MKKSSIKKWYVNFLRFRKDFTAYGLHKAKSYEIILFWLKSRLSRNQFLILSGILVGFTCGLAGVVLKSLVHYIHYVITYKVHFEDQIFFYLIFPFLGIVLTSCVVHFVFKGQDKKGIPAILYEIAQNSSIVSSVKMYSQVIQSAITVGLGGSAGLESPIAVTGAAIGSNFAQTYQLPYRERTLLLAAGATAGIASAFNAPIAGVMFAFEILLTGVVFTDFIPLVVAAVCGSLISRIVLKEEVLFQFHTRELFDYHNIPFYLVLGLICGFYARYFNVISQKVEHYFQSLNFSRMEKAMVGGSFLSLLCLLFPPLFGEGYETVKSLTDGNIYSIIENSLFRYFHFREGLIIIFLIVVCLLKAFATSITIYSGGNGGNFAPSLFAGGVLGYSFAIFCSQIGITDVPETNLVIVGMAGVMSGVLYAPLTAIFLIAESSSGYDLLIPLMMVSVISYLIGKSFSSISPDLKKLADQGKIFTREHDKNLLSLLNKIDLIDTNFQTIDRHASFQELMELIRTGKRNLIAVLNEDNLAGIISLEDVRPVLFNWEEHASLQLSDFIKEIPDYVTPDDSVLSIVKKFDKSGLWYLPVVDNNHKFTGFISKSAVLNRYRQLLQEHSG